MRTAHLAREGGEGLVVGLVVLGISILVGEPDGRRAVGLVTLALVSASRALPLIENVAFLGGNIFAHLILDDLALPLIDNLALGLGPGGTLFLHDGRALLLVPKIRILIHHLSSDGSCAYLVLVDEVVHNSTSTSIEENVMQDVADLTWYYTLGRTQWSIPPRGWSPVQSWGR